MLRTRVLGRPAEDNALWVTADSGQGQTRLLLDCGARVLDTLPFAQVQVTDHLLLSHLHMDHVGGFDDFFRATFDRAAPTHAWGPPGTARILGHRFQGFWWNHAPELRGQWFVHDIHDAHVQSFRFEAQEAFAVAHDAGSRPHDGTILTTPEVRVQAIPLEHHGRSLGFILREPDRERVNPAALAGLGLRPGPWLAALKGGATGALDVHGQPHDAADLRAALMERETGESLAYLTDFLLDDAHQARLAPLLRGVQTLYAEAQYAPEDHALAVRHHHTTVTQARRPRPRGGPAHADAAAPLPPLPPRTVARPAERRAGHPPRHALPGSLAGRVRRQVRAPERTLSPVLPGSPLSACCPCSHRIARWPQPCCPSRSGRPAE